MSSGGAHFPKLQYLEGFLRLKAGREKVVRGRGREAARVHRAGRQRVAWRALQKSGEVPPGLKREVPVGGEKPGAAGLAAPRGATLA